MYFLDTVVPILRTIAEIGILFFAVYGILYYLRSTRGSFVLFGLVALWAVFSIAANYFQMSVISHILGITGNALLVVVVVLPPPDTVVTAGVVVVILGLEPGSATN